MSGLIAAYFLYGELGSWSWAVGGCGVILGGGLFLLSCYSSQITILPLEESDEELSLEEITETIWLNNKHLHFDPNSLNIDEAQSMIAEFRTEVKNKVKELDHAKKVANQKTGRKSSQKRKK